MAGEGQTAMAATPKKRKRRSELEQLLEDEQSRMNASDPDTNDNPWTPRENLELLRIHRDYESSGDSKQWADRLNKKMSRIRRTYLQPQLPGRTDKEFMSQFRQLKKVRLTIEGLEALGLPKEENPEGTPEEGTPRKKPKKKKAAERAL